MKLNIKFSLIVADYGNCDSYSLEACEYSGKRLGLQLGGNGYAFSGDYSSKGCYSYYNGTHQGMIFYSTGGSEDEMKQKLAQPQYRPKTFHCLGIGKVMLSNRRI